MNYLATVDKEGKLCWKRNGQKIDTSTKWRDSPQGIVPVEDGTAGRPEAVEIPGQIGVVEAQPVIRANSSSEDTSTSDSDDAEERGDRYVNEELQTIKGPRKIVHVSPATILNQLLRTSVRKNTWIFVSTSTGSGDVLMENCKYDADETTCKGCRHEFQPLHRHQAIRSFSALVILARFAYLRRRPD